MSLLKITDLAKKYLEDKFHDQPKMKGLKVALKKAGCSGFAYDIQFVEELPKSGSEEEQLIPLQGFNIIFDPKQMHALQGTIIDCIKDDFGEYLQFKNPNSKGACGCGESFFLENDLSEPEPASN